MLDIPDLNEVVKEWDDEVRSKLSDDSLWFAHISKETETFETDRNKAGKHRHARARKDLKNWLEKVNLPYYSPHKFRHGNAVYSLKQADTIADLKAISINLMHSDLKVTDGVYAILSNLEVKNRIKALHDRKESIDILDRVELLLKELKYKEKNKLTVPLI